MTQQQNTSNARSPLPEWLKANMLRKAFRIGDRELVEHVQREDMPIDIVIAGHCRMRSPERTAQLLELWQQCARLHEDGEPVTQVT